MKKIIKRFIAVVLSIICATQLSCQVFAASFTGKSYVKEMVISYGKTADEAKTWLKDNNYKIIDCNINDGADDMFAHKRAVYLGYKTTLDADKAITDMKLMNMNGNYSVLDYKMLLEEQKSDIRLFITDFVTAVSEYRANYKKGQARAVAAHDMLNLLHDDDTNRNIGDLLLAKIKEEYSEEEFAKLSETEQKKHADMTTILMQSNATSVLAIEQLIALATDDADSLWTERYMKVPSYDLMVDKLIDEDNVPPSKAITTLSALYDKDAKIVAEKIPAYREYLKTYTESGITLESSEEEIETYFKEKDENAIATWYTAATQYALLDTLVDEDGMSLLDIITDESLKLEEEDRTLLYPLVSVLTEGQSACLDFLPFYQIVSIGINDDKSIESAMKIYNTQKDKDGSISIYDGIDRSIFSEDAALTGDAYKLQTSSEKDATTHWFKDGISTSTKVLYAAFGVSVAATITTFILNNYFKKGSANLERLNKAESDYLGRKGIYDMSEDIWFDTPFYEQNALDHARKMNRLHNVTTYIGIGLTAISLILMGISAWQTYEDLVKFYNTEFTPIPMHMVDDGVNENGEKVFTYYDAVKCNRKDAGLSDSRTEILKDFGDINGDVGKQWVALYTTTDRAAGKPITADFLTQYAKADIPNETTALSLFGEKSAQNLTNAKANFTYADGKGGIYLFYDTDKSYVAGSAITTGNIALIAGGSTVVCAVAAYFISKVVRNKKSKKENEK